MKQEKEYIEGVLKAAGFKGRIYTNMKELSTSNEVYIAAVLREGELFTHSGSKRIYEDQHGARMKRKKLFERETRLKVIIGDTNEEKCEETLVKFLEQIGKGTAVNRNWVDIAIGNVDWVEEKDSILKAKIALEIPLTFYGGIYKDIGMMDTQIGAIQIIE